MHFLRLLARFVHAEHYFVSGVAETMLVFPVVVRVSERDPVEFQFKANPDTLNKGCF